MFSVITNKTLKIKNIYILSNLLKKHGKFEIDNLKIKYKLLITKLYKTWFLFLLVIRIIFKDR